MTQPLNILVFDCETTSKDPPRQIVELCMQRGLDGKSEQNQWIKRFYPTLCEVSEEAEAIHGISMEDLAGCAEFSVHVKDVMEYFAWAHVLVGYNVEFDLQILEEELARCLNIETANVNIRQGKLIVDAYKLWQAMEPRNLQRAHQIFAGGEFQGAHGASADVAATGRVLVGMLEKFGLVDRSWADLAQLCLPPVQKTWIGPSPHLQWKDDTVVFGFGRYKGETVQGVRVSYVEWCLSENFPRHVHELLRASLRLSNDGFKAFCKAYGAVP